MASQRLSFVYKYKSPQTESNREMRRWRNSLATQCIVLYFYIHISQSSSRDRRTSSLDFSLAVSSSCTSTIFISLRQKCLRYILRSLQICFKCRVGAVEQLLLFKMSRFLNGFNKTIYYWMIIVSLSSYTHIHFFFISISFRIRVSSEEWTLDINNDLP